MLLPFLVLRLLFLKTVHLTNITLVSLSFTGIESDGFIQANPAYDVVVRRLNETNPALFKNFSHIPVRCFNTTIGIGDYYTPEDLVLREGVPPVPLEDVASACLLQFYFAHLELFPLDISRQFTIITTPSISEGTRDIARSITAIPALFALSTPDTSLSDNTHYPNTLNLFAIPDEYYALSAAIVSYAFNWSGINMVCDPRLDSSFIGRMCRKFDDYLLGNKNAAASNFQYTRYDIAIEQDGDKIWENYAQVLNAVRNKRASLIMLVPGRVRDFLVAAFHRNMTNGEYVFLTIAVKGVPSENDIFWKTGDDNDETARTAFKALIIAQEPGGTWNGAADLTNKMNDEFNKRYVNWSLPIPDQAVMVPERILEWMAVVIENLKTASLTGMTMSYFVRRCSNKVYDLPTRRFYVDQKGAMVVPFFFTRIVEDGTFQPFLLCDIAETTVTRVGTSNWFGANTLPSEIPFCGLHNEFCPSNVITIVAFSVSASALLIICAFIQKVIRTKMLEHRLAHLLISRREVQVLKDPKNEKLYLTSVANQNGSTREKYPQTTTKLSSTMEFSHLNPGSFGVLPGRLVQDDYAFYQDKSVRYKFIADGEQLKSIIHNQEWLSHVVSVSRFSHQYIADFIGLVLDRSALGAVYEYPKNGTLKDILEKNSFFHDLEFHLTLMANIIEGLNSIHHSDVKYHGSLRSEICLLSDRYTIRIAETGFDRLTSRLNKTHGRGVGSLCKSDNEPSVHDQQRNDMLNFALIVNGMFEMSDAGTAAIKTTLGAEIQDLISSCLEPEPSHRPTSNKLFKRIKSRPFARRSIVELLMSRLQKQANALEEEVALRTEDLLAERKKVDDLLDEILPRAVIQKLRNNEPIAAELYDNATILFSDIPAFSRFVTQCCPMDIVAFLSRIHSQFDELVSQFDAYKVETINDSYVVASGLPTRNGDRHAVEICSLALRLRETDVSINVPSWGDIGPCLRIGINSGQIAAGVVGKRMPRFCLFGDTMNTASRMESHGAPNRIHVSASTKLAVQSARDSNNLRFSSCGTINVKGKGLLETFWLSKT